MVREKSIEQAVCHHATAHGWLVLKLAGPAHRGQPDRLFLKGGKAVFVEFKAPGRKPTRLQRWWQRRLKQLGFDAHVIDNGEDGCALFE